MHEGILDTDIGTDTGTIHDINHSFFCVMNNQSLKQGKFDNVPQTAVQEWSLDTRLYTKDTVYKAMLLTFI